MQCWHVVLRSGGLRQGEGRPDFGQLLQDSDKKSAQLFASRISKKQLTTRPDGRPKNPGCSTERVRESRRKPDPGWFSNCRPLVFETSIWSMMRCLSWFSLCSLRITEIVWVIMPTRFPVLLSMEAFRSRNSGSISCSSSVSSSKRCPKSARLVCSRRRFRSIAWGDFLRREVVAADVCSRRSRFLPLSFDTRLPI